MRLILNGINGRYLRDIVEEAQASTERVDAAVAYATDSGLLFDWCWDNEIPLKYWGRFDAGVPVAIPVLERFLKRGSARYVCRLIRCFHPKVIWWRGFGAYIGSANLTQSAWWNNVEAGVFLSDEELDSTGTGLELEALFDTLDAESSPLTNELLDMLKSRSRELSRIEREDQANERAQLATNLVKKWGGLSRISARGASDRQRIQFLEEWKSTLQTIRDIAAIVSQPSNRPSWVASDAPLGAQVDQFLHAHYYQRTFDGRRADYATHYEANKSNPDRAVAAAASWWGSLEKAPMSEDVMLNETAPRLRAALSPEGLGSMTEEEFVDLLSHVHASVEFARRVPNEMVGLADGRAYSIPEKLKAMGRTIWRSSRERGKPVTVLLDHILYGGDIAVVPERLWDALTEPRWKTPLLGVSSLGEIVGWGLPDVFPPRNGRTSKALRSLGFPVKVHVGE